MARNYFYMATRYENEIAGWIKDGGAILAQDSYKPYKDWQMNMLIEWAKNDPVSPKEIARNEAVYAIQKNRNPFIDYPGLEEYIWGEIITILLLRLFMLKQMSRSQIHLYMTCKGVRLRILHKAFI